MRELIYGTKEQCEQYNDIVYDRYFKNDKGTLKWATPEFDEENQMWKIPKHSGVQKLEGMYNESELWIEL